MGGGGFDVADPAAEIIGEWMRAQHALQVGVAAGGLFALFGREFAPGVSRWVDMIRMRHSMQRTAPE